MVFIKHYGDVQKIDGSKVPKVDVITFGAPCQDLSVAGGRAGMKSLLNGDEEETRSGLFFEAIRIIKEMREDDRCNGRSGINIRPRFAVYENVTGAYSSGHPKGADFQAVLQEICKIVCKDCPPIPIPKEGWHYSGNLDGVGDDGTPFSISWRTHDAQYWGKTIRDSDTGDVIALGTPQRRRRISVVADFGGTSASKVQFEQYSECGNPEESESEGQGVTRTSQEDIGETSETLSFQERAGCAGGVRESSSNENEQDHCYKATHKQSCNPKAYGMSPYDSNSMKSDNPNSGIYEAETSRTLDPNGNNPNCNQGGMLVINSHDITINEDRTNALLHGKNDSHDIPCVLGLDRASFNQGKNAKYDISIQEEIAQPLVARGPGGVMTP